MRKWFLKLTLRTKFITQSERVIKPVSENGVRTCVHFCLRLLGPLERCDLLYQSLIVEHQRNGIEVGTRLGAAPEIAMIKVVAPNMAQAVLDRAIQAHGAGGLSSDFPLAEMFAWARALRLADGPDEVHLRAVARHELKKG